MNFSQISGNQPGSNIPEKDIMTDVLASQKFLTETYNSAANECADANVRDSFLAIMGEEHQIQAEVFGLMKQHGWYQTAAADQQRLNQVKQKFQAAKAQN